jgi:hypothetical protein
MGLGKVDEVRQRIPMFKDQRPDILLIGLPLLLQCQFSVYDNEA